MEQRARREPLEVLPAPRAGVPRDRVAGSDRQELRSHGVGREPGQEACSERRERDRRVERHRRSGHSGGPRPRGPRPPAFDEPADSDRRRQRQHGIEGDEERVLVARPVVAQREDDVDCEQRVQQPRDAQTREPRRQRETHRGQPQRRTGEVEHQPPREVGRGLAEGLLPLAQEVRGVLLASQEHVAEPPRHRFLAGRRRRGRREADDRERDRPCGESEGQARGGPQALPRRTRPDGPDHEARDREPDQAVVQQRQAQHEPQREGAALGRARQREREQDRAHQERRVEGVDLGHARVVPERVRKAQREGRRGPREAASAEASPGLVEKRNRDRAEERAQQIGAERGTPEGPAESPGQRVVERVRARRRREPKLRGLERELRAVAPEDAGGQRDDVERGCRDEGHRHPGAVPRATAGLRRGHVGAPPFGGAARPPRSAPKVRW